MKSKVIQITVLPESEDKYATLFALCEDGSIWAKTLHAGYDWECQYDPMEKEAINVSQS